MTRITGLDDHSDRTIVVVGLGAAAVVLAAMAVFLNRASYSMAVGAVVALLIVIASLPVFRWLARLDDDPALVRILVFALIAKLVFSVARYWMVNRLYGGGGDSTRYASQGWEFAQQVRSGSLVPHIENIDAVVDPTRRIIKLTGYVFVVTGKSLFAGFFLYSWAAFWGCVLFVRGVRRAFPEMDQRRYLYLVMFWPSLLFWPSSIGKDAVMVLFLGVATYGACRLLAPRAQAIGLVPLGIGIGGMLLIRTHVALMAVLALTVGAAFAIVGGARADSASGRARAIRIASLAVLVVLSLFVATQTSRFFSDIAGEATSGTDALEITKRRTQQGGSAFEPIVVTSPVQVPAATISVLFRPFPWEARNVGSMISAGEAGLIAVLLAVSWKRLLRWPGSAWRRPVLVYSAAYCLMFVVAFSSIGNAGILARQRSQMLPLLFVAVAVPATRWWCDKAADAAEPADGTSRGEVPRADERALLGGR